MNTSILARVDARFTGILAAMLVATLAALLAVFALAKPSEAATTVTVDPLAIDFGVDEVDGDLTTGQSSVTITNNGDAAVQIGGVGADVILSDLTGDFDVLPVVRDAITGVPLPGDLSQGVTVGAGESVVLQITFTASAEGTRDGVLSLLDAAAEPGSNLIQNINLTGTGVNPNTAVQNNCTITGTNNSETLIGTAADDVICALRGKDQVNGLSGGDTVYGGAGRDRIVDPLSNPSGPEKDKLYGEGGVDRINSRDGAGDDVVNGGPKRDRIKKDKGDQGRRR